MRIMWILLLGVLLTLPTTGVAEAGGSLFGWPFPHPDQELSPRGGTTRGPMPEMQTEPGERWRALQAEGLSAQERDRRAILAMAGEYRVSFDFMEVEGYSPDFVPARPYRSWATEIITVMADEPDFVSLQHVLVMHFEQDNGDGMPSSMVTRHWRQDWHYEACKPFRYLGLDRWQGLACDEGPPTGSGKWVQAVYHVDDSPRYATTGRWEHAPGRSSWAGETTWRPLPQREFTVRDDYHVLVADNRQTVTPQGWVHEQQNLKAVLTDAGELDPDQPYLARELGINRYQPVAEYDFDAGHAYLERTEPFWQDVQAAWTGLLADGARIQLREASEEGRLFMRLFALAEQDWPSSQARRQAIDEVLAQHVEQH